MYFRWCNPCRLLTPRIEQLVGEKQGKILLAKVDIDENTDLALNYNVNILILKSILLFFLLFNAKYKS
jgi:thioredoxin-like negative regulator of GroEL